MSLQDKISARFGELQKQVDGLSPRSTTMDNPNSNGRARFQTTSYRCKDRRAMSAFGVKRKHMLHLKFTAFDPDWTCASWHTLVDSVRRLASVGK